MYSTTRDYARAVHHAGNAYLAGVLQGGIVDLEDVVRYGGPSAVRCYTRISLQYNTFGFYEVNCTRIIWGAALHTMRDELADAVLQTVGPNIDLELLETHPSFYRNNISAKLAYAARAAIRNSMHKRHVSRVYGFMRYIFSSWDVSAYKLLQRDVLEILVRDQTFHLLCLLNVYAGYVLWTGTVTTTHEQLNCVRDYISRV